MPSPSEQSVDLSNQVVVEIARVVDVQLRRATTSLRAALEAERGERVRQGEALERELRDARQLAVQLALIADERSEETYSAPAKVFPDPSQLRAELQAELQAQLQAELAEFAQSVHTEQSRFEKSLNTRASALETELANLSTELDLRLDESREAAELRCAAQGEEFDRLERAREASELQCAAQHEASSREARQAAQRAATFADGLEALRCDLADQREALSFEVRSAMELGGLGGGGRVAEDVEALRRQLHDGITCLRELVRSEKEARYEQHASLNGRADAIEAAQSREEVALAEGLRLVKSAVLKPDFQAEMQAWGEVSDDHAEAVKQLQMEQRLSAEKLAHLTTALEGAYLEESPVALELPQKVLSPLSSASTSVPLSPASFSPPAAPRRMNSKTLLPAPAWIDVDSPKSLLRPIRSDSPKFQHRQDSPQALARAVRRDLSAPWTDNPKIGAAASAVRLDSPKVQCNAAA